MFIATTGLFSAAIVTSVVFQAPSATGIGLGQTALGAALVIAPGTLIGGALFSPLAGRMSTDTGAGVAMLVGSLIIFVGYTALVFGGTKPPILIGGVLLGLIGIAFVYSAIPNLLLPAVASERTSEAANLNQVMKSIGAAVGPLVFSAIPREQPGTDQRRAHALTDVLPRSLHLHVALRSGARCPVHARHPVRAPATRPAEERSGH
ncbi:hypothetical protein [Mycobacterium sp. UM_CSW]|uniref:hypothetical protein n=1 Tax=Mycobacterium sp. UM_CSW TaxID=1370119 RepID=UPI001267DA27|nr:hypothetical protein [Mycobacterium sp. UM_CSW]